MDAPLWCHYRKLALWLLLEGILIALSIVARSDHVSLFQCRAEHAMQDNATCAPCTLKCCCRWGACVGSLFLSGYLRLTESSMRRAPCLQPEFYWDPNITDCRQQGWTCQFSSAAIVLLSLNVACLVTYFVMWLWNIARSFHNLRYLPYGAMRMANLVTRMQVRLRGLGITFFILCVVIYTFGACMGAWSECGRWLRRAQKRQASLFSPHVLTLRSCLQSS
jgi:hypothetical protein